MAADGACGADAGGVFAGAAVDDGVDGDLDGVLVGHYVDLHEHVCISFMFRVDDWDKLVEIGV